MTQSPVNPMMVNPVLPSPWSYPMMANPMMISQTFSGPMMTNQMVKNFVPGNPMTINVSGEPGGFGIGGTAT